MPEDDATIQAEGGKRVTITIAEKKSGAGADLSDENDPNTFVIDNGFQILTITIAE
jgi:hypothetical protein